jgi:hypothetical protein
MIKFVNIDPEWITRHCEIFIVQTGKTPVIKCSETSLMLLHNNDKINHRAMYTSDNTFRGYKVIIDNTLEIGVCDII